MNSLFELEKIVKPTFGGHEKFVFRYGWLKKGVDAVAKDPTIFTDDNALVLLGVGKNMVRSIRHWCLATGLLEDVHSSQLRGMRVTTLAERLILDTGWDPYLEDIGTLWLLHWQLASNLYRGLVWHLTFSAYYEEEFSKKQLAVFIGKQLERRGIATTPATIERDVDCCIRTYVSATISRTGGISEESLDCPLAELSLIRMASEDNLYRFNIGPKVTLPVPVFGYALLSFLPRVARNRRTVAVDECLYQHGSPGQVFKLDENSVVDYLETLEELTKGGLRLEETAGLRQIYLDEAADSTWQTSALKLLDRYYA